MNWQSSASADLSHIDNFLQATIALRVLILNLKIFQIFDLNLDWPHYKIIVENSWYWDEND